LYAVGVVGAIAINLGSCCSNKEMPVKQWERAGLGILALIMVCIETTLVVEKPDARYFALLVVGTGLLMRFATKVYPKLRYMARASVLTAAALILVAATVGLTVKQNQLGGHLVNVVPFVHSVTVAALLLLIVGAILLLSAGSCVSTAVRYVRLVRKGEAAPTARAYGTTHSHGVEAAPFTTAPTVDAIQGTPAAELEMDRPHVLVATRGGLPLLNFAASYTKDVRGIMFVLYVRQINVVFAGPVQNPGLEDDEEARTVFGIAAGIAQGAGVPMVPIYAVSSDVVDTILDFAATYNVKALLMGVSRKGSLLRALQGDVITNVADNLPSDIPLLIHA
jgi:nucleotide-binding universal stress UspA family protein